MNIDPVIYWELASSKIQKPVEEIWMITKCYILHFILCSQLLLWIILKSSSEKSITNTYRKNNLH